MLITTRQTAPNSENVLCYFGSTLVVQFTHTIENDLHTFERTNHQLMYAYPLDRSEHNIMVELCFSKKYHGNNADMIYKEITKDYARLLREAYRAIDKGV